MFCSVHSQFERRNAMWAHTALSSTPVFISTVSAAGDTSSTVRFSPGRKVYSGCDAYRLVAAMDRQFPSASELPLRTHTRRTPKPTHATMRARIPERRQREQKRAPVPDQRPLVGWACLETGERRPLSEYQPSAYLHHSGRNAESRREHRRGEHENRNHQTDHASSPSEFR